MLVKSTIISNYWFTLVKICCYFRILLLYFRYRIIWIFYFKQQRLVLNKFAKSCVSSIDASLVWKFCYSSLKFICLDKLIAALFWRCWLKALSLFLKLNLWNLRRKFQYFFQNLVFFLSKYFSNHIQRNGKNNSVIGTTLSIKKSFYFISLKLIYSKKSAFENVTNIDLSLINSPWYFDLSANQVVDAIDFVLFSINVPSKHHLIKVRSIEKV